MKAHAGCSRMNQSIIHMDRLGHSILSEEKFTIRLIQFQIAKHFSMHENIDMHTFSTIHMNSFNAPMCKFNKKNQSYINHHQ